MSKAVCQNILGGGVGSGFASPKPLCNALAAGVQGAGTEVSHTPFALPEDGFFQICPFGTAPAELDGKEVIQVFDRTAAEAIIADSTKPADMLVDYDHFSRREDQSTIAGGWLQTNTLEIREDGIYAAIRMSQKGLADLTGGNFRFGSPEFPVASLEWIDDSTVRPKQLCGYAFTNRPNFIRFRALSNNAGGAKTQDTNTMSLAAIATALGLSNDADEAAILAEIGKLKGDNETLQNREIDKLLDEYKDRLPEDAAFKDSMKIFLKNNRDAGIKVLEGLKAKAAPAAPAKQDPPLHNRETAKTPQVNLNADDVEKPLDAQKVGQIRAKAMELQNNQRGLPWSQAWDLAKTLVG